MGTDETKYETKKVKTLRGVEGRTVDKWQAQGWELVSRSSGKVQTEITFRRPIRAVNPKVYVIAGAAAALVVAVAASVAALTHHSSSDAHQRAESASVASVSAEPSRQRETSAAPSTKAHSGAAETGTKVLTAANSPELAALLADHENCSDSVAAFAHKHAGATISFDGNIASLQPHAAMKTRYDTLLGAGDFSTRTAVGPSFQYRDVNLSYDLHFTGAAPGGIGVGDNVHVVATVDRHAPTSCLFFIKPVSTTMR